MIVWLASYPRSGNTLLRMMLKAVFGRESYSKYDDPFDIGADAKTAALVGHRPLGEPWPAAYPRFADASEIEFVKTHDDPEDSGKAIYVVREGRSAVVSYHRYLARFHNEVGIPMADVIAGFVQYGSWSTHLDAWDPLRRPNTLFLRYEELLGDPERQIDRIAEFCGVAPLKEWRNDFQAAQQINPSFFRQGSADKSISDVQGDDLRLFWVMHGDWMQDLGYGAAPEPAAGDRSILRRLIQRHEQNHEQLAFKQEEIHRALDARAEEARSTAAHIRSIDEQLRIGAWETSIRAGEVAAIAGDLKRLARRIDRWNGINGSSTDALAVPDEAAGDLHVAMQRHARQVEGVREAIRQIEARIDGLENFTLAAPRKPAGLMLKDILRRVVGK